MALAVLTGAGAVRVEAEDAAGTADVQTGHAVVV